MVRQQSALFDELGRLMRQIGASAQQWDYDYDRTDNLTEVSDPRSGLYSYAYDALSRLIRETDQESAQVNLGLDGQDNVTSYSDPRSIVTAYVRNGFGEVIQEQGPDFGPRFSASIEGRLHCCHSMPVSTGLLSMTEHWWDRSS